ncbi:MAG: biotin carboxylase N-terminal domain-containing protein, partial [Myxococcota bacterium]
MTQENNTSGFNKSLSTTRRLKSLSDRPPLRFVVLNRGESAVRFMRSARVWSRRRGRPIELIAVYTDPDAQALFVQMADRGIKLGDPFFVDTDGQRKSSYLDVERMVQLAQEAEADALWPGWGFLGESAELSQACHEVGITFIGPKAGVMKMLGDKVESKTFAQDHNVPVSPWSNGTVEDVQEALKIGERLGYPLIVKAAAGGGGRGIRRVDRPEDLELAFHTARAEAGSAFGDNSLFIETYVDDARHVEVLFVADMFGTVWSLGTRDCSVQRRHQKVLEETPAPALGEGMEERICAAARNMAGSCGYLGAGTAEFLLLPDAQTFYFLEMNARLQVEHTISECVYGVDLVAHQIDIAFGEALPEEPPARRGAAIEARLNAEEPDHGFAPAGGKIHVFEMPGGPGVRVDSGYRQGDSVPTAFDSNIAKIIAYGGDREEAIARLEQALRDTRVVLENGLTNRAMIIEVLTDAEFQRAEMTTGWLAGFLERRPTSLERPLLAQSLVSAALFDHIDSRDSERTALFANIHAGLPQRLPEPQPAHFRYMVDGSPVTVDIGSLGPNQYQVAIGDWATLCRVEDTADGVVTFLNGARYTALCARGASWVQVNTHDFSHRFERVPDGVITADMGSVVTSIAVEPGQQVERGDLLMTVEVMKMEIHINAPLDGVVKAVPVSPSMQVNIGDPLLELTPVSGDGAEVEEAKVPIHEPEVRAGVAIVLAGAILGYDVSDAQVERIMKQLRRDPQLMTVDEMLTVLEAYNTQRALFSANPNEDAINEARESSINQTHWFLMHRQFDTERLHPKTITRLERMFALHDAMGQGGADHIDDYLYRMVQVYLRDADRTNVL